MAPMGKVELRDRRAIVVEKVSSWLQGTLPCVPWKAEACASRHLGVSLPGPLLEIHIRSLRSHEMKTTHRSKSLCSFEEPRMSQTPRIPKTW